MGVIPEADCRINEPSPKQGRQDRWQIMHSREAGLDSLSPLGDGKAVLSPREIPNAPTVNEQACAPEVLRLCFQ